MPRIYEYSAFDILNIDPLLALLESFLDILARS